MFRPGTRKRVPLIESHATHYRANQEVSSAPAQAGVACLSLFPGYLGYICFSHCRALAQEGSSYLASSSPSLQYK